MIIRFQLFEYRTRQHNGDWIHHDGDLIQNTIIWYKSHGFQIVTRSGKLNFSCGRSPASFLRAVKIVAGQTADKSQPEDTLRSPVGRWMSRRSQPPIIFLIKRFKSKKRERSICFVFTLSHSATFFFPFKYPFFWQLFICACDGYARSRPCELNQRVDMMD